MKQKTWQEEVDDTVDKIVSYGFSIKQKDIGTIFMNELGLNRRYHQEKGKSISRDLKDRVIKTLLDREYRFRRGTFFHPLEEIDLIKSFSAMPENVTLNLLWEKLKDTARSEPNISYVGSGYGTLFGEPREAKITSEKLYKGIDFNGKHVIEFGPGNHPQEKAVLERGASSYQGADPFVANPSVVRKDSLSHLLEQESDSSVILSFYVQQKEMFYAPDHDWLTSPKKRRHEVYVERYNDNLAKEIARVLVPGGFVFHHIAYESSEWDKRYSDAGLVKDKTKPGLFWKK